MNDSAYEQLVDRLDGDDAPASPVVEVLLAAAEGPEALDLHLAGAASPAARDIAAAVAHAEPARVYLEQIAVRNFRGIGPEARLQFAPGPGLTLVVGRNGSGKSSFAEGLELLLTGTTLRWADKTRVWREGWRNLHGDGPAALSARFRVDGEAETLDLRRTWPAGAELEDGEPITVSGARDSWEATGWQAPLEQYRPLLSYNELGTMFSDRARALYDALSAVLGLEDFDALSAVLREARLTREKSGKTEKTGRRELATALAASDLERAGEIAVLLGARVPDAGAVEALAAGGDPSEAGDGATAAATLVLPTPETVEATFAALEAASGDVRRLESTDADRLDALASLLGEALAFHEQHGDGATCPVCGTAGALGGDWATRSQEQVAELRGRSRALRDARHTAAEARRTLAALFPPAAGRFADVQDAYDAWSATLDEDDETVLQAGRDVATALLLSASAARDAALAEAERRDSAWRPLQERVMAWVATARLAERDKDAVATLKAAETWMAECRTSLRRERLAPVVQAAQANWAQLRHESNVALGEVELRVSGNQRFASFDVTVDGTAASAFGVMSQGELSALAVSIFLPRAALPASPFGFMVIDDPVQSMDPAKVDGLARVLGRAAEARQVIVFSHDERLPEAVRRLGIPARIMKVQRRAESKVEVVAGLTPSERYLSDAVSLLKTEHVSDEVQARVLPVLCRSAIEAACAAKIRRRLIGEGMPHDEVEEHLARKTSLFTWLADAFELSTAQGTQVTERVRQLGGEDAVVMVSVVNKAAHTLHRVDGPALVEGTRALVRKLEPA